MLNKYLLNGWTSHLGHAETLKLFLQGGTQVKEMKRLLAGVTSQRGDQMKRACEASAGSPGQEAKARARRGQQRLEIRDGGSICLRKNFTRMDSHGRSGSRSPGF